MSMPVYGLLWPLIPILSMLYFIYRRNRLIKKGYMVTGEIVELEKSGDDIYPIVHFITITGETVIKKYNVGQGQKVKAGDKVTLSYNPNNPSEFMINSQVEKWVPLVILGISVIVMVIQIIVYISKNEPGRSF